MCVCVCVCFLTCLSVYLFIYLFQMYNSTIYLGNEMAQIYFQLTAPFGCIQDKKCTLQIQLLEEEVITDENCQRNYLVASDCGVEVKNTEWDRVHSIKVKPRVKLGVYRKVTSTSTMKLTTSPLNHNHGLWANYRDFGNVVVCLFIGLFFYLFIY